MVLSYPKFQQAEQAVLSAIQESGAPLRPATLIERLKERGISDDLVRAAMWYLIDRDRVELTRDLLLVASPTRIGTIVENGVEAAVR